MIISVKGITQACDMAVLKFVFFMCCLESILCQEHVLQYWVMEAPYTGAFVKDIGSDSGVTQSIDPSSLQNLKFEIVNPGVNGANLFSLNANTGELTTSGSIDREVVCPMAETCPIQMEISAHAPPDVFEVIQVTIHINDSNDNTPTFANNPFQMEIQENAEVGTSISIPKAIDLDSPSNGVKGYRLLEEVPEFSLETSLGTDGNIEPVLVLKTQLDRELKDTIQFNLEVFDSNFSHGNKDELAVTITVLDVNDNPPRFVQAEYLVSIPEDQPLQNPIIRVQASDPDSGENGELVYSFDTITNARYSTQFKVDAQTGDIILLRELDYEVVKAIELTVLATEKNPTHMPTKTKVRITVEDVNDNKPEISITSYGPIKDYPSVRENEKAGAFLALVSVSDGDSGPYGQVSCVLENTNHTIFSLEKISQTNYKLISTISLDRETKENYTITFVCRDNGSNPLETRLTTQVVVEDENDHTPMFAQDKVTLTIIENNPVGAELVYLNVSDPDSGLNGEVVFQVLSGPSEFINIDASTGNVTSKVAFDFERQQSITYRVIAFDQAVVPRTATATINFNILDMNDEPPRFTEDKYVFGVLENLNLGADVGQVTASDPDSPPYNKVSFSIVPGSADNNLFVIEPSSGKIYTRSTLDREYRDSYVIQIKAYDRDMLSLFNIVNVTITVEDQNDHKPLIIYPLEGNNTLSVASNPGDISQPLTQIVASDSDSGQNAMLDYIIISEDVGVFQMDPNTGYLYIKDVDKLYTQGEYHLDIKVQDRGDNPLYTQTQLIVMVDARPEVLAMNTIIIIVVGVLSGIVVSTLIIAIALIKFKRRPLPRLQKKENGSSPPKHYTVEPSESSAEGDDVSQLSVNIFTTPPMTGDSDVMRTTPLDLQITQIPHHEQLGIEITDPRDKFSEGSNSDSGLGSNEDGIPIVNRLSPALSDTNTDVLSSGVKIQKHSGRDAENWSQPAKRQLHYTCPPDLLKGQTVSMNTQLPASPHRQTVAVSPYPNVSPTQKVSKPFSNQFKDTSLTFAKDHNTPSSQTYLPPKETPSQSKPRVASGHNKNNKSKVTPPFRSKSSVQSESQHRRHNNNHQRSSSDIKPMCSVPPSHNKLTGSSQYQEGRHSSNNVYTQSPSTRSNNHNKPHSDAQTFLKSHYLQTGDKSGSNNVAGHEISMLSVPVSQNSNNYNQMNSSNAEKAGKRKSNKELSSPKTSRPAESNSAHFSSPVYKNSGVKTPYTNQHISRHPREKHVVKTVNNEALTPVNSCSEYKQSHPAFYQQDGHKAPVRGVRFADFDDYGDEHVV